jgi:hypothetical protein
MDENGNFIHWETHHTEEDEDLFKEELANYWDEYYYVKDEFDSKTSKLQQIEKQEKEIEA